MADKTFIGDGTREIRIRRILVPWREIIRIAAGVESDWRLKQVSADVNKIAARARARTDDKVDAVIAAVACIFPVLEIPSR